MSSQKEHRRSQRGMTLLEILISTVILAALLIVALSFLETTSKRMIDTTNDAFLEERMHNVVDDVVADIREADKDQVTLYRFVDTKVYEDPAGASGSTQDMLCFPTARDANSKFIIVLASQIKDAPQWQGICVYGCYNEALYRYVDRNNHVYSDSNPIRITAVTASTITLSDGTAFKRNGLGMSANQTRTSILEEAARFQMPSLTVPNGTSYLAPLAFNIRLLGIDKSRDKIRAYGRVPTREVVNFTPRMRN